MIITEALAPAAHVFTQPEIDGIAHSFAAGVLRREEAINAWISLGIPKHTAFRWINLAEGI